ncbi:MAG: mechanosensitive ion channel [Treponema sp.]|jgi:small conductance mechanosensitive channel|nr:mechanosensitive ion channel [Treponema sp.]
MPDMNDLWINFWNNYSGGIIEFIRDIITAIIIILAGLIISRTTRRIINRASSRDVKIDDTVTLLLRHVVQYGIFIICLIMILNTFGINTASLLAVLGAAGVAVGLALKDTLGNIAAGILLLILRTYHREDYIEFGAYSGTVKDINLFTTILETPEGIYVSAPNSSIWGTPLKNYTRNGRRRMDIPVSISYSDSIDAAFQVIREIIDAESRFLKDPEPQIVVQSYGDNSITILLRAWAPIDVYWTIYWEKMRSIKEEVEKAGLTIPFPQRDIHLFVEKDTKAT